jgi:hypothetical protein
MPLVLDQVLLPEHFEESKIRAAGAAPSPI